MPMFLPRSLFQLLFVYATASLFIASSSLANAQLSPVTSEFFGGNNHGPYIDWLETTGASFYTNAIYLPSAASSSDGSAIHWKIQEDKFYLAVAVRATGWVGFGIAESGNMKGADIVYYEAASDTLTDAHVLDELYPIPDECQNWRLRNSQTIGGFLIFEAVRELDTGDTQDRPIIDDSMNTVPEHRIISAWGDSQVIAYHGPNNRVRSSIRFYGDAIAAEELFVQTMEAQAEGYIETRAVNYPVKPVDTEYAYFCFSYQDLVNQQGMPDNSALHVVGFEPIVDDDAVAHVHHFVLYGSTNPGNSLTESNCEDAPFIELAYVWAFGESALALPDNVGGPLGVLGFKSFQLEIHYDNPRGVKGILDSSGVRMYYTSQRREHDMGMLQLGDPLVELSGRRVGGSGAGLYSHTFDCPESCSTFAVKEPLTVVGEYLHMHATGIRMYNAQMRGGQEIRRGVVDYFDFDQQGSYAVPQKEFQILPGDSFQTRCYYNAQEGTRFGESSQSEMCIAFLFYWPRQIISTFFQVPYFCAYGLDEFPPCAADYQTAALSSTTELDRNFGSPGDVCRVFPTDPPADSPTKSPTTQSPVTTSPVTSAPSTEVPGETPPPQSLAPVTASPVTSSPVTSSPMSEAPISQAPISSAPMTSPPQSPAPATASPATASPVTVSPVTSSPISAAPISSAPISPAPMETVPPSTSEKPSGTSARPTASPAPSEDFAFVPGGAEGAETSAAVATKRFVGRALLIALWTCHAL